MRIRCPVCNELLNYRQTVVEYGFLETEDAGIIEMEWHESYPSDDFSVFCNEECGFDLDDYPDLRDRIDNLG